MIFSEAKGRKRMSGFGQVDADGNWIEGTDPYNFTELPDSSFTEGTGANVVHTSSGIDWTRILVAGEELATTLVGAIAGGTSKAGVGGSCPSGSMFVAKAGACMTPAAYQAWLQTKQGGSGDFMAALPWIVGGGLALVGVAMVMKKRRRGAAAVAGFGRWHRKSRKVRGARRSRR
jgi:hypothetical protein